MMGFSLAPSAGWHGGLDSSSMFQLFEAMFAGLCFGEGGLGGQGARNRLADLVAEILSRVDMHSQWVLEEACGIALDCPLLWASE